MLPVTKDTIKYKATVIGTTIRNDKLALPVFVFKKINNTFIRKIFKASINCARIKEENDFKYLQITSSGRCYILKPMEYILTAVLKGHFYNLKFLD